MNNASIQPNVEENQNDLLRAEETRLTKLLESIKSIRSADVWKPLQEFLDSQINVLERDLIEESKKTTPDPNRLNRLAGSLESLEKYALLKLENRFSQQLSGIKQRLHVTEGSRN